MIILFSCNDRPDEIPFPENELGYSQPVTVPLQFTAEKKLTWDTARRGGIKPVIKKLDIDALPSTPYDTAVLNHLQPPEEVHFDFNSLPETTFSIDKLSSNPLQFKTHSCTAGSYKSISAAVQKGKTASIFDFGRCRDFRQNLLPAC